MSWYAWAIIWWIGLGAALAIATNSGEGWRKWWVRVAVLLLSLTTLDGFSAAAPNVNPLLASAPTWVQEFAASLGAGCESVGSVAQLACNGSISAAEPSAVSAPHP